MTEFKPTATGPILLAAGKSKRLLEMRNKNLNALAANTTNVPNTAWKDPEDKNRQSEFSLARQLIDQRLTEILNRFPAGKQHNLFKIRYGIDLDSLKQEPIQRIFSLLKINHPHFAKPLGDTKHILELAYNGQLPE